MSFGKVIILNGASSSGKSTILRALQDEFNSPYLDAGLDKFLYMLPPRYLERPLWDEVLGLATRAGEHGNWLISGMHAAIAALSRAGVDVIADHVLVERSWVTECADLFSDLPAYLIGVRCPLEVLVARERERGSRTIGQAEAQHEVVHSDLLYDFEVDTSLSTAQECGKLIARRVRDGEPPTAFRDIKSRLTG